MAPKKQGVIPDDNLSCLLFAVASTQSAPFRVFEVDLAARRSAPAEATWHKVRVHAGDANRRWEQAYRIPFYAAVWLNVEAGR